MSYQVTWTRHPTRRIITHHQGLGKTTTWNSIGEKSPYHSLRGKGPTAVEASLPVLMLLDCKLPRRSGFEVLQWLT